jgi:SP family sugar:H+ symporter-like MFS transporter
MGMPYFITLYTGLPAPASDAPQAVKDAFTLPASRKSLITSVLSAGTFFGAIIAGESFDMCTSLHGH